MLEGKEIETTFFSKKGSFSFTSTLLLNSANVAVFYIGSRQWISGQFLLMQSRHTKVSVSFQHGGCICEPPENKENYIS